MTLNIRPEPGDVRLTCCDCGTSFTFTSGERRFLESKGLSEPRRCKPCRALKRSRRAGGEDLRLF
jgi:hypothetical protein